MLIGCSLMPSFNLVIIISNLIVGIRVLKEQVMFLIAWRFLAPIAFYLHRYGVHWMQTPTHVRRNVCLLLPLLTAISLVDVIIQSHGTKRLTLPLTIGWIVSMGALLLTLFSHTIQRVAIECTCTFARHVLQRLQLFVHRTNFGRQLDDHRALGSLPNGACLWFPWMVHLCLYLAHPLECQRGEVVEERGYFETESEDVAA